MKYEGSDSGDSLILLKRMRSTISSRNVSCDDSSRKVWFVQYVDLESVDEIRSVTGTYGYGLPVGTEMAPTQATASRELHVD